MKNFHWSVALSLEDVCDRCHAVELAWDRASDQAEYGISWYEFINASDQVREMLDKWWETVPAADKQMMLDDAIKRFEQKLAMLKDLK